MTVFNSDGIDIHFDVEGKGRPTILVHGFASNYRINWETTGWIKKFIAQGRQVVALDLRGHGGSDKPLSPSDYHPRRMAGDVIRLMDFLSIDRADLVGYSMGAWISAHLAALFPERLNAVVLGGAGDHFLSFPGRAERMASALTTPFPDAITDRHLRAVREFAQLAGNDIRALAACTRGVYQTDLPEFTETHPPVLFIIGAEDDVAGQPNRFAQLIGGAQINVIADCDHLSALTRHAFKEEVLRFLDRYVPH